MNRIIKYLIIFSLHTYMFSQVNVLQNLMQISKSINLEEQKSLSRAKSHERAGLIKEANLIYMQLFKGNPISKEIFASYKSFLKKQKNWEELIKISKIYANSLKDDPYGKLALADSYLIAGIEDEAYYLFDNLFNEHSSDIKILKRFISTLVHNNKIEYAEQRVFEIRSRYNHPDFYSMDLGSIYFSRMAYEKSLKEYILHLNHNMNHLDLVRGKFMAFPNSIEMRGMIRRILKNNFSEISNIILAEYEFKWKNYSDACDLMMRNYLSEKNLYDFAVDMLIINQFEYAEKILTHLLQSNSSDIVESSIYQLAVILEKKAQRNLLKLPISNKFINTSFSELKPFGASEVNYNSKSILDAIIMYDSLIVNYNNSAAEFKLAKLNFLMNSDYEKSIIDFKKIERTSTNKDIRFQSAIKIIDLYILSDEIGQPLLDLIVNFKKKYKKDEEHALLDLKLNQVYFYLKDFDVVSKNIKEKLKSLSKENEYYNDFLDGLTMIMLFNNKNEELSILSDSFLNMKRENYSEAMTTISALDNSESDIIMNLILYYKSYIYIKMDDYSSAFEQLVKIKGNDIFSQLGNLLRAEIKHYIDNDINLAIDIYLNFLENYESSIYYEDIRLRLAEIIG